MSAPIRRGVRLALAVAVLGLVAVGPSAGAAFAVPAPRQTLAVGGAPVAARTLAAGAQAAVAPAAEPCPPTCPPTPPPSNLCPPNCPATAPPSNLCPPNCPATAPASNLCPPNCPANAAPSNLCPPKCTDPAPPSDACPPRCADAPGETSPPPADPATDQPLRGAPRGGDAQAPGASGSGPAPGPTVTTAAPGRAGLAFKRPASHDHGGTDVVWVVAAVGLITLVGAGLRVAATRRRASR